MRKVLFLILLSLSLRFIHLIELDYSVLANHLTGDEITHKQWASDVLHGRIKELVPFFRAPLYGFFLAWIINISNGTLYAIRFFQQVIGTATVVMSFLIGLELFSPLVALTAGLILASYPLLMYFEGFLFLENLYLFFVMAGILFFVRAIKYKQFKWTGGSALFLSAAALTRPNILFFIPFVFLAFIKESLPKKQILGFSFFLLLMICPVTLVNDWYGKGFCLISTQGGINFYAGNSLASDGIIPCVPNSSLSDQELTARCSFLKKTAWNVDNLWQVSQIIPNIGNDKQLSEIEVSGWWYKKTLEEIRSDIPLFLKRLARKFLFLVGSYEPPNNTDPGYAMGRFFPLLRGLSRVINFCILWVFFLPGCFLAWKLYPRSRWLLLYLISMSAVILAFFVNARFRVQLIPVMALFSAVFIEWLMKKKGLFSISALLIPVMVVTAVVFSQLFRLYPETSQIRSSKALFHNSLSLAYLDHQQSDKALDEINAALRLHTGEEFIFLHTLSVIQSRYLNKPDEAIRSLEKSVELCEHPVSLFDLASLYYQRGLNDPCLNALNRLLLLAPDHSRARELKEKVVREDRG